MGSLLCWQHWSGEPFRRWGQFQWAPVHSLWKTLPIQEIMWLTDLEEELLMKVKLKQVLKCCVLRVFTQGLLNSQMRCLHTHSQAGLWAALAKSLLLGDWHPEQCPCSMASLVSTHQMPVRINRLVLGVCAMSPCSMEGSLWVQAWELGSVVVPAPAQMGCAYGHWQPLVPKSFLWSSSSRLLKKTLSGLLCLNFKFACIII